MSLFSSIGKVLSSVTKPLTSAISSVAKIPGISTVMKAIPGLGVASTAVSAYQIVKGIAAPAVEAASGVIQTAAKYPLATGAVLGATAAGAAGVLTAPGGGGGTLQALPGGAIPAPMGGMRMAGARGLMKSATSYARKYPQWAMSVGGTSGIANLIASGQLPMMRHRRGRGITPRDLRSFKRVARLVSHFSRPVHHMRGYQHRGRK